jgi:hypothetical protein
MFLGTPKAGHLIYPLVSKRLSGRLLCAMLLNGTLETCRHVRSSVARGGKAEVTTPLIHFGYRQQFFEPCDLTAWGKHQSERSQRL